MFEGMWRDLVKAAIIAGGVIGLTAFGLGMVVGRALW